MSEAIKAALLKLDPSNNEHWTADGAPKLDALKMDGVKRAEVVKAAPHFSRTNPTTDTPAIEKAREEAAELAGVPSPEAITVAYAKRDEAKDILAGAEAVLRDAQQEVRKAMATLDLAERDIAALVGKRSSQHDIMDYLAASNARRLAKAAAEGKLAATAQ